MEVGAKYQKPENFKYFVDFKVRETLYSVDSIIYKDLTLVQGYSTCDEFIFDELKSGDRLIITYAYVRQDEDANFPAVSLSICSIDYLWLRKRKVEGWITEVNHNEPEQSIPYRQFKNKIDELCELEVLDESSIVVKNDIANGQIGLSNTSSFDLSIQVFSSAGQLAFESSIKAEEEKVLNFRDYPSDIYFIRFRNEFTQFTLKSLKVM